MLREFKIKIIKTTTQKFVRPWRTRRHHGRICVHVRKCISNFSVHYKALFVTCELISRTDETILSVRPSNFTKRRTWQKFVHPSVFVDAFSPRCSHQSERYSVFLSTACISYGSTWSVAYLTLWPHLVKRIGTSRGRTFWDIRQTYMIVDQS